MKVEKVTEFDFKKIIPEQGSQLEKKISKIVTIKFIALSFAVALGLGLGSKIINLHLENKEALIKKEQQNQMVELKEMFKIAQNNKESIVLNLEQQLTIYDDIIQDILNANQKIPNSAQTILNQTTQLRSENQTYKQKISYIITNFNKVIESEKNLTAIKEEDKIQFIDTVKSYQIGSLNRRTELENLLVSYATIENDEQAVQKEALPIRKELKIIIIDKINKLLSVNELTKVKKIKY